MGLKNLEIMKNLLRLVTAFIFLVSFNTEAINTNIVLLRSSCFSMAREIVIAQDGEINLDNVGFVLELTEYLNTTGICAPSY